MRPPVFVLFLLAAGLARGELRTHLEAFLDSNCYECHDDIDQKGGLDLLSLARDVSDPKNFASWERVWRKVEAGEMPPKEEKKRPAPDQAKDFLASLGGALTQADRADLVENGRVRGRRLTREEYGHSVQDLLHIDIPLGESLTGDAESGFTSEAAHQQMSHFHLDAYLRTADRALEEAFGRALRGDSDFKKRYGIKELTEDYGKKNYRAHELRDGKMIAWMIGMQFYGRLRDVKMPDDGWYEVTIHDAQGINPGPDGAVWATLNSGSGSSNEPIQYPVGIIEGTARPRDLTFRGWVRKGHVFLIKPGEGGKNKVKAAGISGDTAIYSKKLDLEKEGYDGLRYSGLTVRRVYPNGTRDEVWTSLFGDLSESDLKTGPTDPETVLTRLVTSFANRAFRRTPDAKTLYPYHQLGIIALRQGKSFPEALRESYQAILCSPNFLTVIEPERALDGEALATRLSLMLWKTLPDAELRALAASGKLKNPEVLAAQAGRLLDDPRSARFVESFTDQWLELRKIDATQPDSKRYRDYDAILQFALPAETRAFLAELLAEDLGMKNFLRSDFAYLNTRLQTHYALEKTQVKPGGGLQKVRIPPGARSGLVTQAAILKITADGSVTSPVVRGVFVNERILGRHIDPPPPDIPAIEPDVRGAVSIRDQLEKHRSSVSCASCHAKIDPAGFALETYDPIGQPRQFYGKTGKSAKVDPSGVTPDGEKFSDLEGWKNLHLAHPEKLAKNFVTQLAAYGTGGEIRFSDAAEVDRIVALAAKKEYGLRTLLIELVKSPVFREK